jgi:four helix bundle protein
MSRLATTYKELEVYQNAMKAALEIFILTKEFPAEERYSMVDQMRRSSRSVCANLAEAWRKRRYKAAFVAKLSDAEGEAGETQSWMEMANQYGYLSAQKSTEIGDRYDQIMGQLVNMIEGADQWLIR